ncbi:MAG: hypothetical protein KAR15_03270 [Desulfobacterales bacterium]|nr:hypothetical protein [Desulfobacterales bacterium]
MIRIYDYRMLLATFIVLVMAIAGCATTVKRKAVETIEPPPAEIASSAGWWSARFRMYWPPEEEPFWHTDLLIAHKIVAPVFLQYKDRIYLWRFHRRATRDGAGHQFSFIFYASAQTAYQVFDTLRSNALLTEMAYTGRVIEEVYDNPDRITKSRIKDTSDPNWPSLIQKSWPYYIKGVSQMWLNLITETVADMPTPDAPLSLDEYEELYKEVNATVTSLWENNGRHAFLHHLNALFGYKPVVFYEKRMLKF